MEGHARSSATCEFLLCTLHGFHGQNFLTRCYRFSVLDAIPPLLMVSISALSEYTSSNCKRVAQLISVMSPQEPQKNPNCPVCRVIPVQCSVECDSWAPVLRRTCNMGVLSSKSPSNEPRPTGRMNTHPTLPRTTLAFTYYSCINITKTPSLSESTLVWMINCTFTPHL